MTEIQRESTDREYPRQPTLPVERSLSGSFGPDVGNIRELFRKK